MRRSDGSGRGRASGVARIEWLEPRQMLGGWVDTSDRAAVSSFYFSQYMASEGIPSGWTGSLVTGDPGTTTAAFKDAVLQRVNYYRAMVGVPGITAMDATYSQKAQAAALIMSANTSLSHSPPDSWTFYTADGAEGAANSCLALGTYGPTSVDRYMADPGDNNTFAGHRRWILYPQTQTMGTGDVPGGGGFYAANALWVFDANMWGPRPATRTPYVAWPSPGFVPYEVMTSRWSFSYADASFDNATVTLTRNGSPVSLTVYPIADGYGENSLVWEVPGTITSAETQYDVEIGNVLIDGTPHTFGYSVTSFSPTAPDAAPTDITLSAGSIGEKLPAGTLVGTFAAADADPGDSFVYSLVSGAGSADNASFVIDDNRLRSTSSFNVDVKPSYSIRVRVTDAGGLSYERSFTITVTKTPEDFRSEFGLVRGKVMASPALADVDGDQVIFTLTGGGSGKVYGYGNSFGNIILTGTTSKSVLTIKVKKGTGDGVVIIGNISSDGVIKSISAGTATLSGLVQLNTLNQSHGKAAVALRFLQLRDASIQAQNLPIASLKALDWQDTDATADLLTAPAIGSITIAGRKENSKTAAIEYLPGDLDASVTVAGGIGSIKAAGSITGTIRSGADARGMGIGSITAGGSVQGARIVTTGSISRFGAAALLDSDILVGVAGNFTGQFAASAGDFADTGAKLGNLSVTGKKLPQASSHPAYVSNCHISAPNLGTVSLMNVPAGSGAIVYVLNDAGTLKVNQTTLADEAMLEGGTWKLPGVRPGIWQLV